MSLDPRAQAWEDAGYDPLRYIALLVDRKIIARERIYPEPADVGAPVTWEPLGLGVEQPKPENVSPWRHEHTEYCRHPWH